MDFKDQKSWISIEFLKGPLKPNYVDFKGIVEGPLRQTYLALCRNIKLDFKHRKLWISIEFLKEPLKPNYVNFKGNVEGP